MAFVIIEEAFSLHPELQCLVVEDGSFQTDLDDETRILIRTNNDRIEFEVFSPSVFIRDVCEAEELCKVVEEKGTDILLETNLVIVDDSLHFKCKIDAQNDAEQFWKRLEHVREVFKVDLLPKIQNCWKLSFDRVGEMVQEVLDDLGIRFREPNERENRDQFTCVFVESDEGMINPYPKHTIKLSIEEEQNPSVILRYYAPKLRIFDEDLASEFCKAKSESLTSPRCGWIIIEEESNICLQLVLVPNELPKNDANFRKVLAQSLVTGHSSFQQTIHETLKFSMDCDVVKTKISHEKMQSQIEALEASIFNLTDRKEVITVEERTHTLHFKIPNKLLKASVRIAPTSSTLFLAIGSWGVPESERKDFMSRISGMNKGIIGFVDMEVEDGGTMCSATIPRIDLLENSELVAVFEALYRRTLANVHLIFEPESDEEDTKEEEECKEEDNIPIGVDVSTTRIEVQNVLPKDGKMEAIELSPTDVLITQKLIGKAKGYRAFEGIYFASKVAIKEINNEGNDEDFVRQLRQRAGVWVELRHPSISSFYGIVVGSGKIAIVEELLDGGSLADSFQNGFWNSKQNEEISVRKQILIDIVSGLMYLQSKGMEHGSLNSENILLTENKRAKLSCSGIGSSPDLKVPDVLSLGLVMRDLLTGSCLSESDDIDQVFSVESPAINTELRDVIQRCWVLEENSRPTLRELLEAIENQL